MHNHRKVKCLIGDRGSLSCGVVYKAAKTGVRLRAARLSAAHRAERVERRTLSRAYRAERVERRAIGVAESYPAEEKT